MSKGGASYQALVKHLGSDNYAFVCPSPETQGRVVQKRKGVKRIRGSKKTYGRYGKEQGLEEIDLLATEPHSNRG